MLDYCTKVEKWEKGWESFKTTHPFKLAPFNKRNWGNENHSLCSFYGKLKPAIAYHLVKTFSSENDVVFDCFSGSGTVPFEAALNNRIPLGMDINPISVVLSSAKVLSPTLEGLQQEFESLSSFIKTYEPSTAEQEKAAVFGYNKTLSEYYHPKTLLEIIQARKYFYENKRNDANYYFLLGALLHILHGNRPYALSRTSHPITPYAPSGDFVYKSLLSKVNEKVNRAYKETVKSKIVQGKIFEQDILDEWPDEINDVNAIITSPPFFDSTRYYITNWLRSWFLGWEFEDFDREKERFIDTIQKKGFDVYDVILEKCKERLAKDGVVVFHLGKSKKKDMGEAIKPYAAKYFDSVELYNEDVSELEKHGIKDKGTVNVHQYLVMH